MSNFIEFIIKAFPESKIDESRFLKDLNISGESIVENEASLEK